MEEFSQSEETFLRITVKDKGPVINRQFYERQKDERYESEIREKMLVLGGAGYSVSLAGKMAELLGGSIEFRQGVINQNIVEITLPVFHAVSGETIENEGMSSDAAVGEADFNGQGILLVENEKGANRLLAPLLRVNGARVFVVSSGEEGIRLMNRFMLGTITAILVERQLPDMNCYEFARKIKYTQNHSLRKVPVIEMADELQTDDTRSALTSGINAVLNKPVNLSRLAAVIDNLQRNG